MAKKKIEPKAGSRRYSSLMAAAEAAESQGHVLNAVDLAVAAWEYLDNALHYKSRNGSPNVETISAIEIVLHYAPLLLDYRKLDAAESLLKSSRKINRKMRKDLEKKLHLARTRIRDNHRFWTYVEPPGMILETELAAALGGDDSYWQWLSKAWAAMGIIERIPHEDTFCVAINSPLHQIAPAKCPACGKVSQAPKAIFLEPTNCPACYQPVSFCFLKTI
jgi:hypothetical protein